MSAHTPGPWRIGDGARHTVYGHAVGKARTCDPIVANCYTSGDSLQNLANAQLIAAAPELLVALKSALRWIELDAEGNDEDDVPAIGRLRAVIAKAEARS